MTLGDKITQVGPNRIEVGSDFVQRDGDVVTFGYIWSWMDYPQMIKMAVRLVGATAIVLEDHFEARVRRVRQWYEFLETIFKSPGPLRFQPPQYIRTDEDRLLYLKHIALGRVKIPNLGKKSLTGLRKVMIEKGYFPEDRWEVTP